MSKRGSQKPKTSFSVPTVHQDFFTRVSNWTTRITGSRSAFLVALVTVIVWAVSGPFFDYSETWQLVINTGTTIVTFLMVFLIQGVQNRESKAIHIKLDELIIGVNRAHNEIVDIERLTDQQLDALAVRYRKVAEQNQSKLTECFLGETPGEMRPGKSNSEIRMTVK